MKQIFKYAPQLFIIVLGSLALVQNLNKPFVGHHDWNGVQYGNMARNHLRYGLQTTKLGQIENAGLVQSNEFAYNTHHPATLTLLLALSAKVFGVSEASFRLVPILFSVLSLYLIYILTATVAGSSPLPIKTPSPSKIRHKDNHLSEILQNYRITTDTIVGLLAVLFAAVTPMFRYYANMPVHEPVITALALLVFYCYYQWRQQKLSWKWLFFSNLSLLLVGWPGYYVAPIVFIIDWIHFHRPSWKPFLPLLLTAIVTFSLHLLHNAWLTDSPFSGGLLDILKFRLLTLTPTESTQGLSLLTFAKHELRWIIIHFTLVQVNLTAIYIVTRLAKRKLNQTDLIIFGLMLYGVTHALIFRNAAFIHEYMLFYLFPGLAIASALAIKQVSEIIGAVARKKVVIQHSKVPQIFFFLLGFTLVALSFLERNQFYQALAKSDMHRIGYDAGLEIKAHTKLEDKVAVHYTQEYAIIYSKFTAYYADRNLVSVDPSATVAVPADHHVAVKSYYPSNLKAESYRELNYILFQ